MRDDPEAFILANTRLQATPLVPEVALHLAHEMLPLWQLTEDELAESGVPPPFWAFAWAGGQALARHLIDHPGLVAGRRVLDLGCGSGLVAIAARQAGAAAVTGADVDPLAICAARLNAAANRASVQLTGSDLLADPPALRWQVILAGDVFYEQPMSERVLGWIGTAAAAGAAVLVGDPGRTYLPRGRLERLATYSVPTTRELEDNTLRRTDVWRLI